VRPDVPLATPTQAFDRAPGSVLLDVREPEEFAAGHAPGAVNVPMRLLTPPRLPEGRPVLCICRSGNRSGRVAEVLVASGIDARNVTGGMLAWEREGLPIEV
jgi:rhodanese-related sulfurtransferase